MPGQQPQRVYWPCRLIIQFVCIRVASQASLGDYYRVLKHLQWCEGIEDLRQAGVLLLHSDITTADGGVLVARDIRTTQHLLHPPTPNPPEDTEKCTNERVLSRVCNGRLAAGDSLTEGIGASLSMSNRLASAMHNDFAQPRRRHSSCFDLLGLHDP